MMTTMMTTTTVMCYVLFDYDCSYSFICVLVLLCLHMKRLPPLSLSLLIYLTLLSLYPGEVSSFNTFKQTNATGFAVVPFSSTTLTSSIAMKLTHR